MEGVTCSGLALAPVLADFAEREALPGTGSTQAGSTEPILHARRLERKALDAG